MVEKIISPPRTFDISSNDWAQFRPVTLNFRFIHLIKVPRLLIWNVCWYVKIKNNTI